MSTSTSVLILAPDFTDEALINRLAGLMRVDDLPITSYSRTWLDTFDWRLYKAGEALASRGEGDGHRLYWLDRDTGATRLTLPHPGDLPRYAEDLPLGPIADRLTPLMDIRALIPTVTVDGSRRPLLICDDRGDIAVRVTLDRFVASPARGSGQPMPPTVTVEAVEGHEAEVKRILKALKGPGIVPCQGRTDEWSRALTAIGVTPAGWSAKPDVPMRPDEPAGQAVRRVLLHLLEVVEINAQGMLDEIDVECLHDFRVAVRRTRSALSRLKNTLPEKVVTRFKVEFAWLQQISGPARDLDVFVMDFEHLVAGVPLVLSSGVPPMHQMLVARQDKANAEAREAVSSKRFKTICEDWRAALTRKAPTRKSARKSAQAGKHANRPIQTVASSRIWQAYMAVLEGGRAIDETSPVDDMHELRKLVKKLRYLLEFFRGLYDRQSLDRAIKVLKAFQEVLGRLNDAQVQQDFMIELIHQLTETHEVPPETYLAMGAITTEAANALERHKQDFAARFTAFDTKKHFALYEGLFG